MRTNSQLRALLARVFSASVALAALLTCAASAQTAGTGAIAGRVQDVTRGDYLNNARVSIEGTTLTALTNEFGEYQISGVPAGEVKVTAFYSGLPAQTATVTLTPGGRVVRDFELKGAKDDVVKLEAFTVSSSREMSQAAIATNEQRFAPNIKTVLSADEFGEQSENNVAEFLKLMPSVTIDYVEQDARNVSLRGMPAHSTIVTANGNQLASAASGGANRVFEFEQVSINEIARIEVNKSLMPDMPAEGIGGTVNMITKSAFERSRPEVRYRAYLNFNTRAMELGKTPGPYREERHKVRPGFDFTYINPISKNFGFTVSGASSHKFNPQYFADRTWNLNRDSATRVENPYMSGFLMLDAPKITLRANGRVSFDWRFAPRDVITVGYSQQYYRAEIGNRRWTLQTGTTPTTITPDYVQGRVSQGTVGFTNSMNDKSGTTWTPDFKYTHNGPIWKIEAGGAYSHASTDYRAMEKGFFSGVGTISAGSIGPAGTRVNPTVRFDYNGNYVPEVTATYADGQAFNPRDASHMFLASAGSLLRKAVDLKKSSRANVTRNLVVAGHDVRLKAGGDYRQSVRDMRDTTPSFTFLGPDGRANTEDNRLSHYDLIDERYSTVEPGFALGRFRWFDPWKIYDLYKAHPEWWTSDPSAIHTNLVANSRYVDERISGGFIRFDTTFLRNRLVLSGGWRYQNYQVSSESGEVDALNRYLKDDDGNLVLDPVTGNPVALPGNALEVTQRTNVERGIVRKGVVNGFYPSVNAMYKLTEDLQFRTSFANSINYPNLDQIAAATTVSDLTTGTRRVTINRPLNPWFAKNYDLELQYFTPSGGSMTLSWFRKEVVNFIQTATYDNGTPEAAEALRRNNYANLIPLDFEVVEKFNDPREGRLTGWEFALNQNLDRYVPEWGRGATVFFNTSYRAAPHGISTISSNSVRVYNWGGSFRRGRFSTTLKWNHVPEPKRTSPSNTHVRSRTYMDADVTVRVMKNLSVFASGTNIMGVPVERFIYSDQTPEYARRDQHHYFGVQLVAGIRGQF